MKRQYISIGELITEGYFSPAEVEELLFYKKITVLSQDGYTTEQLFPEDTRGGIVGHIMIHKNEYYVAIEELQKIQNSVNDEHKTENNSVHQGSIKDTKRIKTTEDACRTINQMMEQGGLLNAEGKIIRVAYFKAVRELHQKKNGEPAHIGTIKEAWRLVPEALKLKGRQKEQ